MYQVYLNQLQVSLAPLSSDELRDLLNNDEKVDETVDNVLVVLRLEKDSLLAENRAKAESNIEKEPQIIGLRGKVSELTDDGRRYCDIIQEQLRQIKEKSGSVCPESALFLLQAAAAECEEESEDLIKKLLDNELAVEAFLDSFLAARKTMHLRKLKAEKMTELLRKQTTASAQGNHREHAYNNMPSSSFYPPPFSAGSVPPYPLGPVMPMPSPRPY